MGGDLIDATPLIRPRVNATGFAGVIKAADNNPLPSVINAVFSQTMQGITHKVILACLVQRPDSKQSRRDGFVNPGF